MDSLSRISGLLETARDLTLEAARDAASSRRAAPSRSLPPEAIKKLLDSRRDVEILDGLRRVISLFYSNQPVLQYFTAVVKNIANPHTEIKKLVYAFLLQHAEAAPDTALLSINTIQKGLSDSNAQTRALALKTMSSIRVPVISQIVALGIKRGVGDMSPVVRKTAALAIPKCYRLDVTQIPLLEEQLTILLGDKQYYVAGAAVQAFLELCPEKLEMIHPNYKSLVKKIVDMDEWGQLASLDLMLQYCRKCFTRQTKLLKKSSTTQESRAKGFYDDEIDEKGDLQQMEETVILDPDLDLLLKSIQPLLQSRNAAVILAVSRCYLYLGTPAYTLLLPGPLMSILRAAPDISSLALTTIADVVRQYPHSFTKYTTHFLLHANDPPAMTSSKLTLLSLLFPHVQPTIRSLILTDLVHQTNTSSSPELIRACVLAIGRCASSSPTPALRARCLHLLLTHLSSPDATLVGASLDEIRVLIQRDPQAHTKTVVRLAKHLDALTAPRARAAIIWLVGEYAAPPDSLSIAADVWRILLRGFADEAVIVQGQILLLAAKVYLHDRRSKAKGDGESLESDTLDDPIGHMLQHTFLLARYAHSFLVRDRARYLKNLLLDTPSTDLAALLILTNKPPPRADATEMQHHAKTPIGNASWLLNLDIRGIQNIPEWTKVSVGTQERSGGIESSAISVPSAATLLDRSAASSLVNESSSWPVKQGGERIPKTLDQWLDEENDEEGESESEETESDEDEDDQDEDEDETDSAEESSEEDEDDDEDEPLVKA